MKKIVIWGAGKKGIGISNKLRKNDILYFCDSNNNKVGRYINGYVIEGANKLYEEDPNEIILISTVPLNEKSMEQIIANWKGEAYYYVDFFSQAEIVNQMDEDLLSKYYLDHRIRDNIFNESKGNWFREDVYSDVNRRLIRSMKARNIGNVNTIMENAYNSGEKFFDEYFDIRPGMRLIYRIICEKVNKKAMIVDFACGHGELIQKLAHTGYLAHAVDFSEDRLSHLVNVKTYVGDVKKTLFYDAHFDVCICMECMEHIDDVVTLANELMRVTKKNGLIFVTVPYLKYCDDEMHVRQFDETSLWGLFSKQCTLENVITIPYLNYSNDDNLLIVLRKQ